ncbi:hypothetical protein FPV67DRAFT_312197 [Lyophyllum atratum]|nr:hypothetical protein FPV67DRAFT_312197 [Lyophyllum atratum]
MPTTRQSRQSSYCVSRNLVSRYHRTVTVAPKLLAALSSMTFGEVSPHIDEDDDDISSFIRVKTNKSQRKRLRRVDERPSASKIFQDAKLFEEFDICLPRDREEAEAAVSKILTYAKSILEFYFETLRAPDVIEAIQKAFIPPKDSAEPLKMESDVASKQAEEGGVVETPSAYPMVQPMKSALHFNSAEGFGEWRILISTRADGDLREARRKDRKTFAIIVKKIKELSNGHFSDDNQKRLNGPNTDVPIFEAKMTRDTRLVYQVDSISDYDSHVERQVLRVFGIYTHAQLDNRLWDSIGRQLGKKGREYRRRCMHRERPTHSGDNVYMPGTFPPLEIEAAPDPITIDLPPDDLDQIHSLLVLEKYLTFSQELLHSILADLDVAFPFQVSPQEKEIIEHPYSCYVLGRSGTGKTTTMLFKMLWIERTFQLNSNDVAKPRQIFVTKSRVLAGKVEEYFLKLLDSLKTASQSPQELRKLIQARKVQSEDDNLVDIDDEGTWRSDLPLRFSELQDSHFPLFLTFDRLCDLVEADFDLEDRIYNVKESKEPRTFVFYDHFLLEYWPHFPQPLVKGLDPALVFSEIIGIIKGSEETIGSLGYLDWSKYEELSERTQSTFASQRSVIYSVFEAYQAQKRQRGDFDAADRTHGILRSLTKHGVIGQKIDQLYVDEAQDNLLIDALLLRSLSCNTDGLFWAGDTAQTISVGSSFRFNDLKAFLFRIEKRRLEHQSRSEAAYRVQNPPKSFQLATNYRSHAGIVNCAHSVIELITRFWPYSIDTLAPEKGIVEGLKPVFLKGWNNDNVRYEQFLFGSSGSPIEFGAQQCILVRDDAARDRLQQQVGDIGLIMTLYESKGLEFNDVLLFNFFEDSTVDLSQWRLLLGAIDDNPTAVIAAPRFDRIRHAGVCAELKFLYVAITRARKNLWIADHSTKGEPIRIFWTARDQIHNCTPGTDMPRLAVSSSAEEWAAKGRELFDRKKYLQAMHCYERASMPSQMAISNAYYLREQARKSPLGESRRVKDERHAAFITAAEAFLSCARDATKNRTVYFRIAGRCFESGAEDLRAANTYLDAHEYTTAAKLFRKLGLFDEAVAVISAHEKNMQSDVVETIKDVARLYYFREESLEKARQLFSTDEEELEYLEDHDLDIARAEVLTSLGRPAEAAELHLLEGRTLDAIPLFLKDEDNAHSMRQASQCILQEFWRNLSFGIVPAQNQAISQVLGWSRCLNTDLLDINDRDEIAMFKAILAYDRLEQAKLAKSFLETNNTSAATLCLNQLFRKFPQVTVMTTLELAEILQLFLAYLRLLFEFAFKVDPRVAPSIERLFGVHHIAGDEFLVPVGSFIHPYLTSAKQSSDQSTELEISISGGELCHTFTRAICDHLCQRIAEQSELCRNAPQFSSCLTHVAFAYCNRIGCPKEHTSPSALTIEWYNARVRVNLQQVLILQMLYNVMGRDMSNRKRLYIGRFYEAMNPPLYYLGANSLLDGNLIPEFQKGIHVVKDWLRELAYTLNFALPQQQFLTDLIRGAKLGLRFDRAQAAKYLYQSPCLHSSIQPRHYLRAPDNDFMLRELIASLEGSQVWSISAGILSLKHILDLKLPLNASVLCDFIEFLCGSLAISDGLRRRGNLHGITLPRSWLLQHIEDTERAREKLPSGLHFLMVIRIGDLLETIYSGVGAEHLLFESHNLSTIPGVRGVFIARICRALCLLGYNITDPHLRSNIWRAITNLRRVDRTFPALYGRYVSSRHWGGLAHALFNMSPGLLVDELIQFHDSREAPTEPVRGVRVVSFKTNDDLAQLIGAVTLSHVAVPPNEADSGRNQPVGSGSSLPNVVPEADVAVDTEGTEDADDDVEMVDAVAIGPGSDEISNMEALPIMSSADIPEVQPPTAAELHAASIIQKVYKRTLLRRRQAAKAALRSRKFSACLEAARNMTWDENSSYKRLFLGPLPHMLLCLDAAHAMTLGEKKTAKKRWQSAHHQILDSLGLQMTELGKASRSVSRLQKELELTSDVHIRCDIAKLRRSVQEAAELLRSLPFATSQDFRRDLEIAYKGIVARKQPPKAPSKPSLVCEVDI